MQRFWSCSPGTGAAAGALPAASSATPSMSVLAASPVILSAPPQLAVPVAKRAPVFGQAECCVVYGIGSFERYRLCGHSRESGKRRSRTESGGAPVRPIHGGPGRELYRGNRWKGGIELLLPQDRPPQTGTDRISGEHRDLCRSRELRASPSVIQEQTFVCQPTFV
jgi:hypothetical protein